MMTGLSANTLFGRFLLFVLLSAIFPYLSYSQTETDTLNTIVVNQTRRENASRNAKYSPGTKIRKFDNIQQATSSSSLSDLLKKHTSIYIKEYGRGMSSYLSLRGTSSSHTSIEWNGQSLSVPTLGQTDLSHIPLYFFDNMTIHIGGSSALYGSSSLSGNIQLKTSPTYNEGISGDVTLKFGSFTTLFGGGTLRYGKNNWESRTSIYWSYAKNNYKFSNNTKTGYPRERLNNAEYRNWGALQELFRKFRDNSQLQISIMHLDFDKQIQPSVSNNHVEKSFHSILDRNTKVSARYNGSCGKWHYNSGVSYSHDYELYEEDIIAADRIFANADAEYRTCNLSVRGGASLEFIKPDVHAYASGTKEWRGEIFALALWQPTNSLTVGGGIRGAFVTGMNIPVQPAFDIKYRVINPMNDTRVGAGYAIHDLSLRASVSKSAKVPTLNDRYWGGVAENLKAESGTTYEFGADYSALYKSWEFKGFATVYLSDVKNWIRWLPAGEVWRPKNIPKVESTGLETGVTVVKKWMEWRASADINYTFTKVTVKESLIKNDPSVGHQMAYQPKHALSANVEASYKKFSTAISYHYIGKRSTTDMYDIMKGYSLLDLSVKYDFVLFKENLGITGEIKNILNTDYQNIMFYAMPGINFGIAVQWKF